MSGKVTGECTISYNLNPAMKKGAGRGSYTPMAMKLLISYEKSATKAKSTTSLGSDKAEARSLFSGLRLNSFCCLHIRVTACTKAG